MAAPAEPTVVESAVDRAAHEEDVVVGDEIVRHKLSARLIHWSVAVTFILLVLTGLPIWTPIFGWMAALFGGLAVCRWLHPWIGAAFFLFSIIMFFAWRRGMKLEKGEGKWLGPKMIQYFRYQGDDADVGKYNGGQKIFFFLAAILAVVVFATGFVLWFPVYFGLALRQWSLVLHDASFILFVAAIIVHIYLGTAAEPGTFHSMTRGTVSKPWARLHHPRWYREVTGDRDRPS